MKFVSEEKNTGADTMWTRMATPPKTALKEIKGGNLGAAGLSMIDPMWRYKALTKEFGACGEGWKYEIVRTWETEAKGKYWSGTITNVEIIFQYRRDSADDENYWSSPIPAFGSSKLTDDEALKGALTDAISVATKMIGVAADVYMGYWDGNKYNKPDDAEEIILRIHLLGQELINSGIVKDNTEFTKRIERKFGGTLGDLSDGQLLEVEQVLILLKGGPDA